MTEPSPDNGFRDYAQRLLAISQDKAQGLRRPFTRTEAVVVALIAQGMTYAEAARFRGVDRKTIESHVVSAADKLIDSSHPQAAELAKLRPPLRVYEWARRVDGSRP